MPKNEDLTKKIIRKVLQPDIALEKFHGFGKISLTFSLHQSEFLIGIILSRVCAVIEGFS